MRRVVIAGVLASGLALSGWLVVVPAARQAYPQFQEVNSAAILSAIGGISGGGTEEDTVHSSGDTGTMVLCVRQDTQSDLAADGDYVPCSIDDAGNIRITGSVLAWAQDGSGNSITSSAAGSTRPLDVAIRDSSGNLVATASAGVGASDSNTTRVVQAQVTPFKSIDLDESEEDVKTSAGEVCSVWVTNTATATRWVKFYNATAANVTVGTTTPLVTIGVGGNTSDDISGSFATGNGCLAFGTAISVAATTGVADNDTGAPGANEVIVMVGYR